MLNVDGILGAAMPSTAELAASAISGCDPGPEVQRRTSTGPRSHGKGAYAPNGHF